MLYGTLSQSKGGWLQLMLRVTVDQAVLIESYFDPLLTYPFPPGGRPT